MVEHDEANGGAFDDKIEFAWDKIPAGAKVRRKLTVPVQGSAAISLPLLVVKGAQPGPTLLVSAGVHGDEYEGVQAIFDLFAALEPSAMRGALVAVPSANPPAFWSGSRTSPLDDGNLARVFPGQADGSATSAIAWHFDQKLLPLANLYVDLHSAGVKWLMPTLVGYHAEDALAGPAAEAFGAPVIWQHPKIAAGRTVSAAFARGIPSLYVEARGAGRIHPDDLRVYRHGLWRLLLHFQILDSLPVGITLESATQSPVRLFGDGNIDRGITATQSGFLTAQVNLLQSVGKGELLGRLQNLWGETLAEYVAPSDGVVVLVHACPLVQPGEPLFLLTDRVA